MIQVALLNLETLGGARGLLFICHWLAVSTAVQHVTADARSCYQNEAQNVTLDT